jgi:lysyl-tRNA synthetase class 2
MLMTVQTTIQEVLFFPQMRPEKKIPKDPASAFTAIGIPEEWVPVLQKAGYNMVADLKGGNPQKIQQEIGGINKKYKLNYTTPSVNDVTAWVEKLD